jgi:hypothetical protein
MCTFNNICYEGPARKFAFKLYEDILESAEDPEMIKKANKSVIYLSLADPRLWKKDESLIYHYAKKYFKKPEQYKENLSYLIKGLLTSRVESFESTLDPENTDEITKVFLEDYKFKETLEFIKAFEHAKLAKSHQDPQTKPTKIKTQKEKSLESLLKYNRLVESLIYISEYKKNLDATPYSLDSDENNNRKRVSEILNKFTREANTYLNELVVDNKGENFDAFLSNFKTLLQGSRKDLLNTPKLEHSLLQAFASALASLLSLGTVNYFTGRSAFHLFSGKTVLQKKFDALDKLIKAPPNNYAQKDPSAPQKPKIPQGEEIYNTVAAYV